jgi:hypothetical protein
LKRYNICNVLSEGRKFVTKLTIQDESLLSCGDLKEYFKFDILSDCMEKVPVLEVMAILKIHHMVVEVFSWRPDGRVFSYLL